MGNPWLLIGGVIAIVMLGLLLLSANKRIGELESKLATQASETREAADANQSNLETISALEQRIAAMIEERRIDVERRDKILLERETELEQARADARRLQIERDNEAETNLQCAEYRDLVMADFCPAGARQLRDRSRGASSHGDQDGH